MEVAGFYLILILIIVAASFLIWLLFSGVWSYRRLCHIPTPSRLAGLSYLWLGYITWSGKQYWVHRDLHKKYGPLVRIGPNEVMTDDPEILKKVASTNSTYRRAEWYLTGRFNPYFDNLFTILDPIPHQKAKQRSMPAYLGRETPGLDVIINDKVKLLIKVLCDRHLTSDPGQNPPLVNLGVITNYFTMDVITHLGFGHETGYLRDDQDHYRFLEGVRRLWPQMSTVSEVPWMRRALFSTPMLKLFGPKHTDKEGFGALMGAAREHVNRRFELGEGKKSDMLETFIKLGFNRQECESEGLFLLLSGTESTACAMRQILVHAITAPAIYDMVKEEIMRACREGSVSYPITMVEAKKLPCLQAIIYEGIRMRPPLLGTFPKVVPSSGETFHGHFIPAGTSICTNGSSLLRSKTLFGNDAEVYNPMRFIHLEKSKREEMERNVELTFGYGQWMCAGKTIAFMEMNKVIFELLRHFNIQLVDPLKPCDVKSYGVFLEPNLYVRITKDQNVSLGVKA
ncbi:cytochrome P450 [Pseudovirgaria hyperparasitica]|uniref:Cytochrome P450 n=1 Tax=Pseudovirgaria hyperparasitica TaxID=470096 RepID=A0A6A6W1M0_9PEZI|nr:cytochrome P450 [Pseudovirgaria hyperparasitica]KAF2754941.1 cytochrome P450 [Pseudovirgaria hyperparasitica]